MVDNARAPIEPAGSNRPGPLVVALTRRPEDIPEDELGRCCQSWIMCRAEGGSTLLMTRAFVDGLRAAGWQGTEHIPPECIIDA